MDSKKCYLSKQVGLSKEFDNVHQFPANLECFALYSFLHSSIIDFLFFCPVGQAWSARMSKKALKVGNIIAHFVEKGIVSLMTDNDDDS